jgi:hypothetical protein
MQPENKFLNGDFLDRGFTGRPHVYMVATQHIGKEANDWERQAYLGLDKGAQPSYGTTLANGLELATSSHHRRVKATCVAAKQVRDNQAGLLDLKNAVECDGLRTTARRLAIDPSNLRRRLKALRKTE